MCFLCGVCVCDVLATFDSDTRGIGASREGGTGARKEINKNKVTKDVEGGQKGERKVVCVIVERRSGKREREKSFFKHPFVFLLLVLVLIVTAFEGHDGAHRPLLRAVRINVLLIVFLEVVRPLSPREVVAVIV